MTVGLSTALIAAITALFAAGLTYISTNRRDQLQARIEICKYREKWLEQLRHEMTEFNTICVIATNEKPSGQIQADFFNHMNKITLLVNDTNKYWPDLHNSMGVVMRQLITREETAKIPKEKEAFIIIAKKILKEEWNQIQFLLDGKKIK